MKKSDQKTVILGAGIEGQSAARFLVRNGVTSVTIVDPKILPVPAGVTGVFGEGWEEPLATADIILRSPGTPLDLPALMAARARGATISSGTRIFLEGLPALGLSPCPARIAGVTGSNGKTTCTTLLHKMVHESWLLQGRAGKVWLGGNIGISMLDFLDEVQPEDLVILEVSSFQIEDAEVSPWLGLCLNVTPNHLDHHRDFAEYAAAKRRIVDRPGNEWSVLNLHDEIGCGWIEAGRGSGYVGQLLSFGEHVVEEGEVRIHGEDAAGAKAVVEMPEHELGLKTHPDTLAGAVVAALKLGAHVDDVKKVLHEFHGVEHRLELIRELDGVKYYDDSANTTPESTLVALHVFPAGKIVILLGGSDKGTPFDELAKEVVARRARVVLMGQTSSQILAAIRAVDPSYPVEFEPDFAHDFSKVMARARQLARPGDVVLLSTACASFGMFENYKDRAAQFTKIVEGWS